MDKLTKRIRCNPDGTLQIKRWDNGLLQVNKFESVYETATGYQKLVIDDPSVQVPSYEEYGPGWETELDYF